MRVCWPDIETKCLVLQLTDGNLSALLRAYNSSIASVHEDSVVATAQLQEDAPWSLDRLDQARLPLDEQFHYNNLGTGVNAYIVDTVIPWSLLADMDWFSVCERGGAIPMCG